MKKADLYLGKKVLCKISIADTFWTRFMGLMGKTEKQIRDMGGLLISPCSQIHTFFMKDAIDVVYLSGEGNVVHIDEEVKPFRCCKRVKHAKCLVEFPKGTIKELGIKENNKLEAIR
jgi:hypothetical protein